MSAVERNRPAPGPPDLVGGARDLGLGMAEHAHLCALPCHEQSRGLADPDPAPVTSATLPSSSMIHTPMREGEGQLTEPDERAVVPVPSYVSTDIFDDRHRKADRDDFGSEPRRTGWPDHLKVLLERYPREVWSAHQNLGQTARFWLQRHDMFRDLEARFDRRLRSSLRAR